MASHNLITKSWWRRHYKSTICATHLLQIDHKIGAIVQLHDLLCLNSLMTGEMCTRGVRFLEGTFAWTTWVGKCLPLREIADVARRAPATPAIEWDV
jgi:hypothetical protein